MTSSVRLSLIATAAVIAAAIAGVYVSGHRSSASLPSTASLVVAPVIKDTGIIAVDARTGNLRSDLGWRKGSQGEVPGVVRCMVGTETAPVFKRLLLVPNSPIVNPAWVWSDCERGFHQWDSLETSSGGKWPATASAARSVTEVVAADVVWRDAIGVREARALMK